MRVVLPAPGCAVTTTARDRRTAFDDLGDERIDRKRSFVTESRDSETGDCDYDYAVAPTPTGQVTPVPPRPQ